MSTNMRVIVDSFWTYFDTFSEKVPQIVKKNTPNFSFWTHFDTFFAEKYPKL